MSRRCRLPNQNGSPSLPKCLSYAAHSAPLRACGEEAHSSTAPGIVAIDGLIAFSTSTSTSAATRPPASRRPHRAAPRRTVPSRTSEARRVHLDDDAIAQRDALARLTLDELLEHRHGLQQAQAVAHDGAGLAAVGGDDHDRALLAGSQERTPVREAGEEDCDNSEDEDLPAPLPPYQPSPRAVDLLVASCVQCASDRSATAPASSAEQTTRHRKTSHASHVLPLKNGPNTFGSSKRVDDVHSHSLAGVLKRIGRYVLWHALEPKRLQQAALRAHHLQIIVE